MKVHINNKIESCEYALSLLERTKLFVMLLFCILITYGSLSPIFEKKITDLSTIGFLIVCSAFFGLGGTVMLYSLISNVPSCTINASEIIFRYTSHTWRALWSDIDNVELRINNRKYYIYIRTKNEMQSFQIFGFSENAVLNIYEKINEVKLILTKKDAPSNIINRDTSPYITSIATPSSAPKSITKAPNNTTNTRYISSAPFSFSRVKAFYDCKMKFKFKYIENIDEQSKSEYSKSAQIGKVVHEAISLVLSQYEQHNSLIDIGKQYSDQLTKVVNQLTKDNDRSRAYKLLSKFISNYHIPPGYKIYANEKEMLSILPSGHQFKWIPDLILSVPCNNGMKFEVVDFKTGETRFYNDLDVFSAKQVLIYASLIQKEFPLNDTAGNYYFIEKNQWIGKILSPKQGTQIIGELTEKIGAIHAERRFAPSPGPFACSTCDFKNHCKHAFKRKAA